MQHYSNPFYFSVLSGIPFKEVLATSIWKNHLKLNICITSNTKQKQKHLLKVNNSKKNLSESYFVLSMVTFKKLSCLGISRVDLSVSHEDISGNTIFLKLVGQWASDALNPPMVGAESPKLVGIRCIITLFNWF